MGGGVGCCALRGGSWVGRGMADAGDIPCVRVRRLINVSPNPYHHSRFVGEGDMADLAVKLVKKIVKKAKKVRENKELCDNLRLTAEMCLRDLRHLDASMRESPQAQALGFALNRALEMVEHHASKKWLKKMKAFVHSAAQQQELQDAEKVRRCVLDMCILLLSHSYLCVEHPRGA